MSSLGDLSALVGQLAERNQESHKVLNCVEGKLAAMDLDLEVWLLNDPLTSHMAVVDGKSHVVAKVIGFGPHVDVARLKAARAAGCDEVLPRSAFFGELDRRLGDWAGAGRHTGSPDHGHPRGDIRST